MPRPGAILHEVFKTVQERKEKMPEKSYVAALLRSGTDAILCKIAEETGEVVKAAREQEKEKQVKELCDLVFHAMVLMAHKDITFEEVEFELAKRHGISGLDEKAARTK
ncbi:MAG: phosphoribosyl-ATP diphosphatase [Planctomycetota bacterium]|nr:phosphoribosyl-ATP diphosphatase [Planctomycetota bacterium]